LSNVQPGLRRSDSLKHFIASVSHLLEPFLFFGPYKDLSSAFRITTRYNRPSRTILLSTYSTHDTLTVYPRYLLSLNIYDSALLLPPPSSHLDRFVSRERQPPPQVPLPGIRISTWLFVLPHPTLNSHESPKGERVRSRQRG